VFGATAASDCVKALSMCRIGHQSADRPSHFWTVVAHSADSLQCAHGPVAGVARTLIVGSKSDGNDQCRKNRLGAVPLIGVEGGRSMERAPGFPNPVGYALH
jgi:hypothetical protein